MHWRLYFGISSIFVLGGVAGSLLGVHGERERQRKSDREGLSPAFEAMARRLENELKLDEGQSRRVREIYTATRPQLIQVEKERRRRLLQLLEGTEHPILEILTPTQKERFQQLQQKLQLRLRLRDEPKAGDPPAPPIPAPPQT